MRSGPTPSPTPSPRCTKIVHISWSSSETSRTHGNAVPMRSGGVFKQWERHSHASPRRNDHWRITTWVIHRTQEDSNLKNPKPNPITHLCDEFVHNRTHHPSWSPITMNPQWLKWGGEEGGGAQPPDPIWAPCNSMSPPIESIKCYFMHK